MYVKRQNKPAVVVVISVSKTQSRKHIINASATAQTCLIIEQIRVFGLVLVINVVVLTSQCVFNFRLHDCFLLWKCNKFYYPTFINLKCSFLKDCKKKKKPCCYLFS